MTAEEERSGASTVLDRDLIVERLAAFDAPFWPGKLERLSEGGRCRHGLLDDPAEAR